MNKKIRNDRKVQMLAVDAVVLKRFKKFVVNKYGRLWGNLGKEAELALEYYMKEV